jgi:NAD(P)H-nitrite reductase large subunit
MKKKHIIIGASAAGIGVLSKLRALAPEDEITCIASQNEMPFNTCLLANYLSTGIQPTTLYTKPENFFKRNNINLKLATRVTQINSKAQKITDHTGQNYQYDTLFLGIGTQARRLRTDFTPTSGYFQFHTLSDAIALDTFVKKTHPLTAIIVGAGLSGIECADALTERGVKVTIIDPATHPLATLLTKTAGDMLELMMKRAGTTFYANTTVQEIVVEPFTGKTIGVELDNGIELFADMVVCAIGANTNLELSMQAAATIISGGILVDKYMQIRGSNSIFAGGDVATVPTPLYVQGKNLSSNTARSCTWPDAMHQGMIAANSMAGAPIEYPGVTVTPSSHFYGTQVISSGGMNHKTQSDKTIIYAGENWYHFFTIENDTLQSFFMLGNMRNVGVYRKLLASQKQFDVKILDPLRDFDQNTENIDAK